MSFRTNALKLQKTSKNALKMTQKRKKYSMSQAAIVKRDYRARKKAEKAAPPVELGDIRTAIEWIGANLKVPSGPLAGQPFKMDAWQSDWLISASQDQIHEAGLSISRKNGKSGLIAALLLAYLVGPLNRLDWRGVVTSLTGLLAKELRDAVELTAEVSGYRNALELRKSPPPGILYGMNKAHVRFLAADKATGHAIGADLVVIDEMGLLQENKRELVNALISSCSGRDGKLWGISIQGDGPMFAEMESRAGSPGVHFQKWTSEPTCDLDDMAAWIASNPGLESGIKSLKYMAHQATRAKETPGNEMHFRAYDLNQPVNPEKEPIVTVSEYAKCIKMEPPEHLGDCVIGIDLGGTVSMTCAAVYWPDCGYLRVWGAFGDEPDLTQRANIDRMGSMYDRMVRAGELQIMAGKVTPVVQFVRFIFDQVNAIGSTILMVGLDRYRRAEATQAFREANITPPQIQWRGQGAGMSADGSHDVRAFQRLVKSGRLITLDSPMLESAIANSVIRYDNSGNPAVDKKTDSARIDALSASVIAAGIGEFVNDAPLFKLTVV